MTLLCFLLACTGLKPSPSDTEEPEVEDTQDTAPECPGLENLDCLFGQTEEVYTYVDFAYPFYLFGDVTVCELGCSDTSIAVTWLEERLGGDACSDSLNALALPATLSSESIYTICLLGVSVGETSCRFWTSAEDRQPTAVVTLEERAGQRRP